MTETKNSEQVDRWVTETLLVVLDSMWSRFIQSGDHYPNQYKAYKQIRERVKNG